MRMPSNTSAGNTHQIAPITMAIKDDADILWTQLECRDAWAAYRNSAEQQPISTKPLGDIAIQLSKEY